MLFFLLKVKHVHLITIVLVTFMKFEYFGCGASACVKIVLNFQKIKRCT